MTEEGTSRVRTVTVMRGEDGLRLDKWLKARFPALGHGPMQKLLRTGQVRVDGGRVQGSTRLEAGQEVRLPPALLAEVGAGGSEPPGGRNPRPAASAADLRALEGRILHMDDDVLVIDKPAGLAVQGGSGVTRHLDGMLDGLKFGAEERPRLVHRLDKDTSGVLALARNRAAARWLAEGFRRKTFHKLYWAAVAGLPHPFEGRIVLALDKKPGPGGREAMEADPDDGLPAETLYRVIDRCGDKAAWLAMEPITGRTHQLRAHARALGTPILGDGKYGGRTAFPEGLDIPRKLHLHARRLFIRAPSGDVIDVVAPLPAHMSKTWDQLGFAGDAAADAFMSDRF